MKRLCIPFAVALCAVACQPTAAPETAPPSATLPVSHNEVMVALVNHAADPIWVAAWRNPSNDAQWRELERLAYQLRIAGSLLEMPGTGPMDAQWASDEGWRGWTQKLAASGELALEAAKTRDLELVGTAGDRIVDACEGCHLEFKPDLPTGGLFGEISPNEDDFDEGP
ncbi:MAG: hypothetical protein AAGA81_24600 [Acidobacteriota bacterium]